jgi:hypothetical protein
MEKGKKRKKRRNPTRRKTREGQGSRREARRISGVGDEAYWDGSTLGGGLFVLKGDTYFRLSVGGPTTRPSRSKS